MARTSDLDWPRCGRVSCFSGRAGPRLLILPVLLLAAKALSPAPYWVSQLPSEPRRLRIMHIDSDPVGHQHPLSHVTDTDITRRLYRTSGNPLPLASIDHVIRWACIMGTLAGLVARS